MNRRMPYALFAAASVSACMSPDYTPQRATSLSDGVGNGSLCKAIEDARTFGKTDSLDILIAEYRRRNTAVAARWIDKLRKGLVSPGMPEKVAACSWNATLVGQTIGYGANAKRYRGIGGYSVFFVNGRTGKVEFISA